MLTRTLTLAFASLALLALSAASPHHARVELEPHFRTVGVPAAWQRIERADADELITLTFAVKQRNTGKRLHDELMKVSDPQSPWYGRVRTKTFFLEICFMSVLSLGRQLTHCCYGARSIGLLRP